MAFCNNSPLPGDVKVNVRSRLVLHGEDKGELAPKGVLCGPVAGWLAGGRGSKVITPQTILTYPLKRFFVPLLPDKGFIDLFQKKKTLLCARSLSV